MLFKTLPRTMQTGAIPPMIRLLFVSFFGLSLAVMFGPVQAQNPPANFKLTKAEQEIVDLTNEARKKEGLPPVKVNQILTEVARAYSVKMAKAQKLDHFLDNTKVGMRAKEKGYKYAFIGENLAAGNFPVPKMFKGWMDSEKHRKNIMEKKFVEIGVGIVPDGMGDDWYTQILALPKAAP
jgi:uncharacterized protein YkwD